MSRQIDTVSNHANWPLVGDAVSNAAPTETFQIRDNFPPVEPTVRIIFHGLLSFFFDGNRKCQVGIPNITQGLGQPHRHPHEFQVNVWTIANNQCPPVPLSLPIGNPKLIEKVDITVTNPQQLDGVYVYEKNPASAFDRLDPQGTNDPKDWRWVLDVESDLMYPTGVSESPETLKPSVFINNGLFYTYYKTKSTFLLHPSDSSGDKRIGTYAEILACNIYLATGSNVTISIPPLPIPITLVGIPGFKYQIDITNNCKKNGQRCRFTQSGPKENRNDFYLYYQTFALPPRRPEYELRLENEVEDQTVLDICQERNSEKKNIDSSRSSPCGGVVHSQTSAV
jgi:hypothetical protein